MNKILNPKEIPHELPKEKPNYEVSTKQTQEKLLEVLPGPEKKQKSKGQYSEGRPDIKMNFKETPLDTVWLSGKINIKTIKNWMIEHMGAYPKIRNNNFFVRFLEHDRTNGFVVIICKGLEKGDIKIDGISYKICKYEFNDDESKKYAKKIIEKSNNEKRKQLFKELENNTEKSEGND